MESLHEGEKYTRKNTRTIKGGGGGGSRVGDLGRGGATLSFFFVLLRFLLMKLSKFFQVNR